ncbi:MAG: hypothetical protein JRH15_21755, partial [Deltaproteobacteria bacterium]|nr:hypothetical protein [Deltaproteobacteria bacterium]
MKMDVSKQWVVKLLTFCCIIFCYAEWGQAVDSKSPEALLNTKDIRENIFASAVISKTEYIMVGSRGKIFRTENNGKKWKKIDGNVRKNLYSVSFPDPMNGWISGQSGVILRSRDGGRTWEKQRSGTDKYL